MNYIKTLILLLFVTARINAQTISTEVFGPDNTLLDFSGKTTLTHNGKPMKFECLKENSTSGRHVFYEVHYITYADINVGDVFTLEAEVSGLEAGYPGDYEDTSKAPNCVSRQLYVGGDMSTHLENYNDFQGKQYYGVSQDPFTYKHDLTIKKELKSGQFVCGHLNAINHYMYSYNSEGLVKEISVHFYVYPKDGSAEALAFEERVEASSDDSESDGSDSDDSEGKDSDKYTWVLIPAALLGLGAGGYVLVRVIKPSGKAHGQDLTQIRAQQQQYEQQLAQEAAMRAEEERERRIADELRRIQEEQHQWTSGQIQKMINHDTAFDRTLQREREARMIAHEKEMRKLEVRLRNRINVDASDDEVRRILSQRTDVAMEDRKYYNMLADKYDTRLNVVETAKTAVDFVMDITSSVGQGGVKTVADTYKIARNYASHLGAYKAEDNSSFTRHMAQATMDSLIEYGQSQVKGIGYKYGANCFGDFVKAYANGLIEGKDEKEIEKDVKKAFTTAVGNTSIDVLTGGICKKLTKAAHNAQVTKHMLRKKELEGMRQFMGLSNRITDALQNDSATRMAQAMSRFDNNIKYGESITTTIGQTLFGNYMND